MADDFLGNMIGDQKAAQLLRVFVFNQRDAYSAGELAKRSRVPAKGIEAKLKYLEKLGIIKKGKFTSVPGEKAEKTKEDVWMYNMQFKHSGALSKFVHEVSPVHYESVVDAIKRSGRPTAVILSGVFVGDPSRPADLLVALDAFNERRLEKAMRALEPELGREIRYAAFSTPEFRYRLTVQDRLIRDTLDFPHLVLLDKTRML